MNRRPLLSPTHGKRKRLLDGDYLGRFKLSTVVAALNILILLAVMGVLYHRMTEAEFESSEVGQIRRPVNPHVHMSTDSVDVLSLRPNSILDNPASQVEAGHEEDGADEEEEEEVQPPPPQTKQEAKAVPKAVPPPVKIDIPQAPEVKPLGGKYEKLWTDLKEKQQAVLALPRLRKGARISCGGTGTMGFRTWQEIKGSSPQINQTLPVKTISIPTLAAAVGASPCFKESKYKKPGCEFYVPSRKDNREPLCAVVGNSGKLRYQHWQNEIDSCDIVIRFNNGITKGFEKQVGTKSTIRLYNGPYVSPKQPGEITIAEMRDLAIRHWVKNWTKRPPGETLAFVMDPELICHAWDWVGRAGEKPSSGIVGIMLGLNLCRHVHVFGFSASDYFDKTVRPHYYDWERPKPGREDVHPFAQEAQVYRMLQDAGKLTLHE